VWRRCDHGITFSISQGKSYSLLLKSTEVYIKFPPFQEHVYLSSNCREKKFASSFERVKQKAPILEISKIGAFCLYTLTLLF